jgi:hypothetical protein
MLGIFLLAEKLTASQKGPCSNDSEAPALSAFKISTFKIEAVVTNSSERDKFPPSSAFLP